jgi:hypothetical protein
MEMSCRVSELWRLFFDVIRLIIVSPSALVNSMTWEVVTPFRAAAVAARPPD